jgi:thiopeptide-type bacteriocin biosynthesis protein
VAAKPTAARRRFAPGSEWLYLKLYTGTSTADEVLRQLVVPASREAIARGDIDRWFFIRYGDPDWHLRARFHGDPGRLQTALAPRLTAAGERLVADGLVWRVQLDTYEREVERYGGELGIELAERIFCADSEAVGAIVELLQGDAGMDARWRLATRGADMLLDDLGLDLPAKLAVMTRARDNLGREFSAGTDFAKQLGAKFRGLRDGLYAMLARDPAADAASELEPGLAALARRSQALAPVAAELRAAEAAGRLTAPIAEMAWSYVHMHANRLLRSVARAQELVIYDFLQRYYESLTARARGGRGATPPG